MRPQGLACLLPLGFLAICTWVAWLKDLKGSIGGAENGSDAMQNRCLGFNMFLCKYAWTILNHLEPKPILGTPTLARIDSVWVGIYRIHGMLGSNLWENSLEKVRAQAAWCHMPCAPCAASTEARSNLFPPFSLRLKIRIHRPVPYIWHPWIGSTQHTAILCRWYSHMVKSSEIIIIQFIQDAQVGFRLLFPIGSGFKVPEVIIWELPKRRSQGGSSNHGMLCHAMQVYILSTKRTKLHLSCKRSLEFRLHTILTNINHLVLLLSWIDTTLLVFCGSLHLVPNSDNSRLQAADVKFLRACSFLFMRFRPGAEFLVWARRRCFFLGAHCTLARLMTLGP